MSESLDRVITLSDALPSIQLPEAIRFADRRLRSISSRMDRDNVSSKLLL